MTTTEQINAYFDSQKPAKRADMQVLDQLIRQLLPDGRLWFSDGRDETGKVVTNPTVGYGQLTTHYKDGSSKAIFQIGMSGNTSGISIYIMGLPDKNYLPLTFGSTIGKATVTGYCIRFRSLADIKPDILQEAIRDGIAQTGNS